MPSSLRPVRTATRACPASCAMVMVWRLQRQTPGPATRTSASTAGAHFAKVDIAVQHARPGLDLERAPAPRLAA
ncbi:hypothetical protein GCM10018963_43250 [Saccharothrix longispora]